VVYHNGDLSLQALYYNDYLRLRFITIMSTNLFLGKRIIIFVIFLQQIKIDIFVIEDVLLNKIVHIKSVDLKYDHRALIQNKLSALESPRG